MKNTQNQPTRVIDPRWESLGCPYDIYVVTSDNSNDGYLCSVHYAGQKGIRTCDLAEVALAETKPVDQARIWKGGDDWISTEEILDVFRTLGQNPGAQK